MDNPVYDYPDEFDENDYDLARLTDAQKKTIKLIAKHMGQKKKKDSTYISNSSLRVLEEIIADAKDLCREIFGEASLYDEMGRQMGVKAFARALIHYTKELNASITGKTAGKEMLASKQGVSIDITLQTMLARYYERLDRELVRPRFYDFILYNIPADEIVWACLFSADDQVRAESLRILDHKTPDIKKVERKTKRIEDISRPLLDFNEPGQSDDLESEEPYTPVAPKKRFVRAPPAPVKKRIEEEEEENVGYEFEDNEYQESSEHEEEANNNIPKTSKKRPRWTFLGDILLEDEVEMDEEERRLEPEKKKTKVSKKKLKFDK